MKYRIVLLFDRDDEKSLKDLNKCVNNGIQPDIEFDDTHIPHVTLVSGIIETQNFGIACNIVEDCIHKNLKTLRMATEGIRFSSDEQWLFIDLKTDSEFENFLSDLRNNLKDYMQVSPQRKTHITIAKSCELLKNINIINRLIIPKSFMFTKLAIGESGENGTFNSIDKEFFIKDFRNI